MTIKKYQLRNRFVEVLKVEKLPEDIVKVVEFAGSQLKKVEFTPAQSENPARLSLDLWVKEHPYVEEGEYLVKAKNQEITVESAVSLLQTYEEA